MPARTLEGPVAPPPSSSGLEPPRASGSPALYAAGQVLDAFSGFGPLPDGFQPAFENFRPYSERSPSQLVATMNSSFCRPMFRAFAPLRATGRRACAPLPPRFAAQLFRRAVRARYGNRILRIAAKSLRNKCICSLCERLMRCSQPFEIREDFREAKFPSPRSGHGKPRSFHAEDAVFAAFTPSRSATAPSLPHGIGRTVSGERYRANGNRQKTERRRRPPPR